MQRVQPAGDIIRQLPGRIRFTLDAPAPPDEVRRRLGDALPQLDGELRVTLGQRTGRYLATFPADADTQGRVVSALGLRPPRTTEPDAPVMAPTSWRLAEILPVEAIARETAVYLAGRLLIPPWLRPLWTGYRVAPFAFRGLRSLLSLRVDADTLDGVAVTAAMAIGDYATAGTVAYLLRIGELIEEATAERAREDLAAYYAPSREPVWVERDGTALQIAHDALQRGERVIVRAGSQIPVDGSVLEGSAAVNEHMMTGETVAVAKRPGSTVWAGTVIEEGRLLIEADAVGDATRRAQIVLLLADASRVESKTHTRARLLADKVAPLTFAASGLVYLLTANPAKAVSVLMVDYSCAIKLCGPLAVNAALIEATRHGALVKGGRFIEQLARADMVVVDKTGTLTRAEPSVVEVVSFGELSPQELLRNAACLEEHFPHPVAKAVVRRAEEEGLQHEERHSEVELIVAHGIASRLDGKRILIGSRHFVEEDEGIDVSRSDETVEAWGARGLSALYVTWGGQLAGAIAIDDPIHPQALGFIRALHELGLETVMLTGDSERAARTVASELGIDRFHAQALPDDKVRIVQELQAAGRCVVVIGDGMNDSAAISHADIGVSMDHGADLAQQAANIVLMGDNLESFIQARRISEALTRRIDRQSHVILSANTLFLAMALLGVPASWIALLHNGTTVATCATALRSLLDPAPGADRA